MMILKMRITILCCLMLTDSFVHAEALKPEERGSQILDTQLKRAQRLTELEYQAEVLERQARIARAQEQIDKTVGLESSPETSLNLTTAATASNTARTQGLPHVIELGADTVRLQLPNGVTTDFSKGDFLPSGHRIESISLVKGVRLSLDGHHTYLNFQW